MCVIFVCQMLTAIRHNIETINMLGWKITLLCLRGNGGKKYLRNDFKKKSPSDCSSGYNFKWCVIAVIYPKGTTPSGCHWRCGTGIARRGMTLWALYLLASPS